MLMTVLLMAAVGLCGCSRHTSMPPVVVTQTSLQSDSLVRSLFSLLVSAQKDVRTDSFVRTERYTEKTTVNENGDTLRHDTRTEISTEQYRALEHENRVLCARVDSLEKTRSQVDTVPVPYEVKVPYPVERRITAWETVRLWAFWPLVICVAAIIGWRFLRRRWLIK